MGRTPNDDRSDTMNPNNDAHWADHENRFGSEDSLDRDEEAPGPAQPPFPKTSHPLDDVADPDLGPPDRHRRFDLAGLRWTFEDALATPASRERDRAAAVSEALRVSERILNVALEAAVRQGVGAQLIAAEGRIELLLNDGRSIRMVANTQGGVTVIGRNESLFTYDSRTWCRTRPDTRKYSLERPRGDEDHPVAHLIEQIKTASFTAGIDALREAIRNQVERWKKAWNQSEKRERSDVIAQLQATLRTTLLSIPAESRGTSWEDSWSADQEASTVPREP